MKRLLVGLWMLCLLPNPAWGADGAGVTTVVLAKTGASWDGAPLPPYPRNTPEITILRITIPAGTTLPLHTHPVINAGVLLSGELTVVTEDNKTLHLKAGDPIIEVVNTWHHGTNPGNTPAEILVFYAGAADTAITVKQ